MSITSYLAYPVEGQREVLLADLAEHPHCEVVLAENADVFILVTDTRTREEERATEEYLREHEGLLCLAMVHGQWDDMQETEESTAHQEAEAFPLPEEATELAASSFETETLATER